MNNEQKIEGLLFIAGSEGMALEEMCSLTGFARPAILSILETIDQKYQNDATTALKLIMTGGTYKLVTKPELSDFLGKYFDRSTQAGLSSAALEILSIIAYRQPITRVQIDQIRGVQSGASIQNLVLRNLVKVIGRLDEPGRPKTYGTTAEFLDYFGLKNISDLPALPKSISADDDSESDLFLKEFESKLNTTNKEK